VPARELPDGILTGALSGGTRPDLDSTTVRNDAATSSTLESSARSQVDPQTLRWNRFQCNAE